MKSQSSDRLHSFLLTHVLIFLLIFAHQNFLQNLDQSLILSLLRGAFGFSALGRASVLAGSTAPLLSSFLENPSKLRNVYSKNIFTRKTRMVREMDTGCLVFVPSAVSQWICLLNETLRFISNLDITGTRKCHVKEWSRRLCWFTH